MKKKIYFVAFICSSLLMYSFKSNFNSDLMAKAVCSYKNSTGAPAGRTGAPGEPSCATSLCHAGTTQDGTLENNLVLLDGANPVTDYIPGQVYNVTLMLNSNPDKRGFQATCLTASNMMAGTFSGQVPGGTAINSSAGRSYANHTNNSNESSELSLWTWTWTAPATNVGPVTFYVAANKTNNSNTSAGDVIYLSQHTFSSTASIDEKEIDNNFNVSFNQTNQSVNIEFDYYGVDDMYMNLVDINGKSVFRKEFGKSNEGNNKINVVLPNDLKNGTYFVHLFIGNKPFSGQIVVF